ncbi:restriction endonuclease subunit S [Vibrio parahaemolyticus]|nr:restriction endonuclease subunit S [Vibrio parahaemolyticus]
MTGRYKKYPEYKESGIEWLEKIPTHWSSKALKFLCTYNDEVINETTDPETIIEYVDIGSVSAVEGISKTEKIAFGKSPSRARRIVRNGDVIVSTVRTYLEAIAPITNPPKNMIVSTGFAVIRPNSKLDKGFAAYCLRAKGFIREVVSRSVGISYPAINATELVGISVPYLPYEEQQKIANFLDHETAKIDTLITKQEKLIELLKEKRQAVISHAVTKGLNPDAPMKNSGVEWLGEVPEHWAVAPIKHFISDRKGAVKVGPFGSHLKNTDMLGEDVKVIAQKNVISKDISVGEAFISWEKYEELQAFTIEKGDLLITTRGTLGRTFIYDTDVLGILHPCLIRLQCNESKIKPELLALIIERSGYAMEQILVSSNSTTIEVIYSESLMNTVITLPKTLSEQCELLNYLEEQDAKFSKIIANAERSIALMGERKTALISAAVTGKIDVRDWDAKGVQG